MDCIVTEGLLCSFFLGLSCIVGKGYYYIAQKGTTSEGLNISSQMA